MRIIFSRKGFDSTAGGCPSPIFPDGTIHSLPIPDKQSTISYSELQHKNINLGNLIADLSGDPRRPRHFAHLDPDIRADDYPREDNWRPLLGQTNAAQGHLRKQKIQVGDLFLFFGLFRQVEKLDVGWRFVKRADPIHCFWGWLQIGEIVKVDELEDSDLMWARYHPHFQTGADANNTLYLAGNNLRLHGEDLNIPASGVFQNFHEKLQLTDPKANSPTHWRLPMCFYPDNGKPPLSYHGNAERWRRDNNHCYLNSVSRGQEFVLDAESYPGVDSWLTNLLVNHG